MKHILYITTEHMTGSIGGTTESVDTSITWLSFKKGYTFMEARNWNTVLVDRRILTSLTQEWWLCIYTHCDNIVVV